MIYGLLRSELGLSWDDIMDNISFTNLMMLAKCTPNYSLDNNKKSINKYTVPKGTNKQDLMPEVGAMGNVGSFQNLVQILKSGAV